MKQIVISQIEYEDLLQDLKQINRSLLEDLLQEQSKPQLEGKKYLTIKEVAALFNITVQTVHRWIRQGLLTRTKLGKRSTRLHADEVLLLMKAKKQVR